MTSTDRIVKQITLRAPIARVWRALSDSREFGAWFGAEISGPFVAGARVSAKIRPTQVDPEVAAAQAPYNGTSFELYVETLDAPRLFSFRWSPGLETMYLHGEPLTTRVEFVLREVEGGTLLQITESGFDQIPLEKRAKIFAQNEGGWEAQTRLVSLYLNANAA